MVDLLVERATFGHGGNQEVIRPLQHEVMSNYYWSPHRCSPLRQGARADSGEVALREEDVPHWDDEFPFWQSLLA